MQPKQGMLAPVLATALLVAVVLPIAALGTPVEEADLDPNGRVYELNRDAAGHLFLSDYVEGDVWEVDPTTGTYQIYEDVASTVEDARPDGAGRIWWTDNFGTFGRIDPPGSDPSIAQVTSWEVEGNQALWGVALDDAGQVWMPESYGAFSKLYRFDPATRELCAYHWTGGISSYYALVQDGLVWLGNSLTDRILRFDPASDEVTYWPIGSYAEPKGLALDERQQVWWADLATGALVRLEPEASRITTYALPVGSTPEMIVPVGGRIAYAEDRLGTVGMLDPALAAGSTKDVVSGTLPTTVDCEILKAGKTAEVAVRSGVLAWTGSAASPVWDQGGWLVYQLPDDGAPYGVANSQGYLWATDYARRKLVRFTLPAGSAVYLPLVSRGAGP